MNLEHNETKIGTSSASFFPDPDNGHKGTFTLTNRRLIYEGAGDGLRSAAKPDEDVSWTSDNSFEVDRKNIVRVDFDREGSDQLVTVWLAESSLEFNFGTSNIARIQASFEAAGPKKAAPLSLTAKVFRLIACTLVFIVLSDIAGVIVTTVVDVLGSVLRSFGGMMIMYAVWFVLGAFTGFFLHAMGGDLTLRSLEKNWMDQPGAAKTGFLICGVALPIVFGLTYLSVLFSGYSDSIYVPGNTALTVVYFVAITIGIVFSQYMAFSPNSKSVPEAGSNG